jgi:hypothetical protein
MRGPHTRDRRRAEHRRRVHRTLLDILNDPAFMPNADAPDLVVLISHLDFGASLNDIFVDISAFARRAPEPGAEPAHDRHMRQARERGEDTYIDLTDVCVLPQFRPMLESELQKRLGLAFTPRLHLLRHLGRAQDPSAASGGHPPDPGS